jgi:small-conductance mechanosensitive channel
LKPLLLILFVGISLSALLVTVNLLVPVTVEAARRKMEADLVRSFLVGLVNLIFALALLVLLGFITTLFEQSGSNGVTLNLGQIIGPGIFVVLGVLLALTVLLFTLRGLSAFTSMVGARIGVAKSPFWSDVHGGLLLILACLTPYIGWFVFTPFVLSVGLGASVQTLLRKKTKASVEEKTA